MFIIQWYIISYVSMWLSCLRIQTLFLTFCLLMKSDFMKRSRLSDLMIELWLLIIWNLTWRFKNRLFIRYYNDSDCTINYMIKSWLIMIFLIHKLIILYLIILKNSLFTQKMIMMSMRDMLLTLTLTTMKMIYRQLLMIKHVIQFRVTVSTVM